MINPRAKLAQQSNNRSSKKPRKGGQNPGRKPSKNEPRRQKTTQLRPRQPKLSKSRLILVWFILVAGMLGLGWRLYQLQIVQASDLLKKARQQHTASLRPYIPRRTIVDSQRNVLASDRLVYSLFVHPKLFAPKNAKPAEIAQARSIVANELAKILDDYNAQDLLKRFNEKESGIRLASALPEAVARRIEKQRQDLRLDGIELVQHYARFYPQEDTAADIIGYVDLDHKGQAGIELGQRLLLEQDLKNINIIRTGNGNILPAFVPDHGLSFDGLQLELTIDMRLQRAARVALRQQLKKYNAKRGAVIVMDARDGSLLTLVCEPTFNPNEYYKSKVELFKNWTVSDLYEPGSTFKPINIAIALEAGVIKADSYVHDSGSVIIDGWPIKNASKVGYGTINIAKVLQTSSNVGMIRIMERLKKKDYYEWLRKLDLGEKTGIDLPGEVAGTLKSEERFLSTNIEPAVTSFGQGFSLTPIKLVQLHGALANEGKLVTPHLVQGLVDDQGKLHWEPKYPSKRVFSPEVAKDVVRMMETVVSEGTGESAQIAQYRIGGKTGTAQKAGPRGGYIPNAKITSFVSILPIDSPRYVVLAVVDEPQGGNTFGSTVAAPIAKSVMEALISLKGIPPSKKDR